ncbi:50S ribosomal protein L32e [Candidatus Woesearchaeota archaeon]|nr:50S ribosomal protein L32e [Candidatus Woesearchaeota archaeon]MBT5342355.1 50S ribosomal protein L32e [Candidatus Woesearchaeota archaeon]
MADERLLKLKEKNRKTRSKFVVKESKFSARVKSRWRFPRGKHSKVRQMHRGRPKLVSTGFRSPKAVRGLHSSGLEFTTIGNVKELVALNPEKQGAVISKIGNRKRLELLKLALEKKIVILNVKNVEEQIKKIEDSFTAKKKIKEEKSKVKNKKEEDKKKNAEEKKKKEEGEKKSKETKETPSDDSLNKDQEEVKKQKKDIEKTIIKKQ